MRRRPRNPLRCPVCFRLIGASKHGVIGWHKNPADGRKCAGIGRYGGENRVTEKLRPRREPCASCPFRQDAPSGLWDEHEYDKLRKYDGSIAEQAIAGATTVFCCHSSPDRICAGWAGTFDMEHNLAVRMHAGRVDYDALASYESPVPLFGSGAEAADHGMADYEDPPDETVEAYAKLDRSMERQRARGLR